MKIDISNFSTHHDGSNTLAQTPTCHSTNKTGKPNLINDVEASIQNLRVRCFSPWGWGTARGF